MCVGYADSAITNTYWNYSAELASGGSRCGGGETKEIESELSMKSTLYIPPDDFLYECELAWDVTGIGKALFVEVYLSNWFEYGRTGELEHVGELVGLALQRIEAAGLFDVVTRSDSTVSAFSACPRSAAADLVSAIEEILPRPASTSGIRPVYALGTAIVDGPGKDELIFAFTDAQDIASGQSRRPRSSL
jgi:hypothetical protein